MSDNNTDNESEIQYYMCGVCQQSFVQMRDLTLHYKTHTCRTSKRGSTCDLCGTYCSTECKMKYHYFLHCCVDSFACKLCDSYFKTKEDLQKHKIIHDTANHLCTFCKKSFRLRWDLQVHYGSIPSKSSTPENKETGNKAVRKRKLKGHCQARTGEKQDKLSCKVCGRLCATEHHLNLHCQIHNSPKCVEKSVKCTMCHRTFSKINFMKSHYRKMHLSTTSGETNVSQTSSSTLLI